jgi:hypothetical protein
MDHTTAARLTGDINAVCERATYRTDQWLLALATDGRLPDGQSTADLSRHMAFARTLAGVIAAAGDKDADSYADSYADRLQSCVQRLRMKCQDELRTGADGFGLGAQESGRVAQRLLDTSQAWAWE